MWCQVKKFSFSFVCHWDTLSKQSGFVLEGDKVSAHISVCSELPGIMSSEYLLPLHSHLGLSNSWECTRSHQTWNHIHYIHLRDLQWTYNHFSLASETRLQDAFVLTLLQVQEVESWLFGTAGLQVMSLCSQWIHMILIFFSWCQNESKEGVSPFATAQFFFLLRYIQVTFISNLSHEMFITFCVT